jgi:hypothetical protein
MRTMSLGGMHDGFDGLGAVLRSIWSMTLGGDLAGILVAGCTTVLSGGFGADRPR